jgi:Putative zinc-finger
VTDHNQFGSAKPVKSGDPQQCAQCEVLLTDAIDGTLSPADQAAFDLHMLTCPACSEMLADAQRGAAWLELLKSPRPEPSAALLERIFAQTSGQLADLSSNAPSPIHLVSSPNTLLGQPSATAIPATVGGAGLPYAPAKVLPFRSRVAATFNLRSIGHTLLQPRLAMTAAMAFFSVALTMNLTGVRLSELRASDLKPSSLKRSFYEANAHVVRYYDNLRVVYELESRVHDMQSTSEDTPVRSNTPPQGSGSTNQKPTTTDPGQPQNKPDEKNDKQDRPRPSPGTSRRENLGIGNMHYVVAERRDDASTPLTTISATLSPSVNQYVTVQIQEGRLV